ncbi:hypothetical protein [Oceanicoccus sagamiensis]|uniref:Uncharacterized protein n=1 Tax=Oceanicoccus sagamiensis TaxID=716816 RepID=A0A1X9N8F1_9GAMM|nr:hypothetical protein [Oceanicoccus sagamiensis]ARN73956.1 hypothetical protein BST96_07395 [Oceanicoccus sagamiensis]
MYFEIRKEWQSKDITDAMFGITDRIRFPLVEFSFNQYVFLVDAVVEDCEGLEFVKRFMLGSVSDTLRFIEQPDIKDSCIALFSRRCDNDNDSYSISDLIKIITAKDSAGQIAHIYQCKDGQRYVDSLLASSEEALTDFHTIYYRQSSHQPV